MLVSVCWITPFWGGLAMPCRLPAPWPTSPGAPPPPPTVPFSPAGTVRYSSSLIQDEKRAAAALMRVSKMMAKVTGRSALELGALHDNLGFMPVRGGGGGWGLGWGGGWAGTKG